jgi:excisionase family DNA binding protein
MTDTTAPTPAAFDPDGFARHLGLGRTTVYAMVKDGRLRSVKVGRRRLIPATEVERLLSEAV